MSPPFLPPLRGIFAPFVVLILFALTGTSVQAQNVAGVVRGGSPGVGLDAVVQLSDHFNTRIGASFFQYGQTNTSSYDTVEMEIDTNAQLFSISVLADYFPWTGKSFHLTGGLFYNGNSVDASAVALNEYTVGNLTFTPEEIGSMDAEVSFAPISPYLGLGFGNPILPGKRLGMTFDIGVLYHHKPSVSMNGSGLIGPTADEAPKLEADLESFRFFPVVSLGLAFRITP